MIGAQPTNSAAAGFMETCAQGGGTVRSFGSVPEFMAESGTMTAVYCGSTATLMELYGRGAAAIQSNALAVVAVDQVGVAAQMFPRPAVLQPGIARLGQAAVQLLRQVLRGERPSDIRLDPVIFEGDPVGLVVELLNRQSVPAGVGQTSASGVPVVEPPPIAPETPASNPAPAIVEEPAPAPAVTVAPPPQVEVTPPPIVATPEPTPEPAPAPEPMAEPTPAAPENPAPNQDSVITEDPAPSVIATEPGEPEFIDPQINADRG
jgi:hypothetical protein